MQRTVLLTLLITIPFVATAQTFFENGQLPRFNHLDRNDGLPNNAVSSIQQDVRGYLWFGTQGGLTRYDGRSFATCKNIPFDPTSLPHDLVQTIYYDESRDTLWVGTYRGLARLTGGAGGFERFAHDPDDPRSLSNDVVISICRGPDGALWVGTQDGLNRMTDGDSFERIDTPNEVIRSLYRDTRGVLWIGTYAGLSRWDPDLGLVQTLDLDLPSAYVMTIGETDDGLLTLGLWDGGLVEYRPETGLVRTTSFADNKVYTVLNGSDGTTWVGTWGGGLFVRDRTGHIHEFSATEDQDLSSPIIYSLFEDDAGLVWVGTNGGGLHYLSPRQRNFRAFYHDSDDPGSLPAGRINDIYRDSADRLWVGLYGGGLARYDDESRSWHSYRAARNRDEDRYALADDIVNAIYEDSAGRFWVGTNGGLQQFLVEEERFLDWERDLHPRIPFGGDIAYALTEDSEGYLWIGTYRFGVSRFDPRTQTIRYYRNVDGDPHSLVNNLVYDIYEDSVGTVWLATNGGLSRYRSASDDFVGYIYREEDTTGLASNTVRVIYEDSQQRLWFGTVSGGLNLLNRRTGTFSRVTTEDGLSSNTVVGILEDEIGRLWLATQQGLNVYDTETGAIEVLDERDGLYGSEFQNGHFKDRDGSLYFGGGHGITRFDTSALTSNTHEPRVHISNVTVFQEPIAPNRATFNGDEIELSPDDDFLGFEFVALDYESPSSNQYAYQLVGFDRDWIYAGTRNYATYTNLRPGEYELQVLASNADGYWTTEPATLRIIISSPWYRRWWAFVAYAALALVVVGSAWRLREARVLAGKNRDLEYANAQLATANKELERLSIRDALTGSFNRRYFDTRILEEWGRARRAELPLALLMIDIDHFKSFNDTFGHVVGDHMLTLVAKTMSETLTRAGDFVARYGGEEFVALLYDTDEEGALAVAERLRGAVEAIDPENGSRPVTISVGVVVRVPRQGLKTAELIHEADAALYRAKRSGRNCVVVAAG